MSFESRIKMSILISRNCWLWILNRRYFWDEALNVLAWSQNRFCQRYLLSPSWNQFWQLRVEREFSYDRIRLVMLLRFSFTYGNWIGAQRVIFRVKEEFNCWYSLVAYWKWTGEECRFFDSSPLSLSILTVSTLIGIGIIFLWRSEGFVIRILEV